MEARITINLDNAAFKDSFELSRILREIAYKVENGRDRMNIYDVNGNKVGLFEIIN